MQDSDSKAGAGEDLDGERERNNSVPTRWVVDVYGHDSVVFVAETKDKARYAAFKAYREAYPCSFREFIARGVTIRKEAP